VRQGDLYDLALPKETFDVVIIHQVSTSSTTAQRAIAEAARVLLRYGRLMVIDFSPHDSKFLRDQHRASQVGFAFRGR